MKPKLHHKIPLQPNLTLSQSLQYMEFYRYLEHYNFGPYYVDSLLLKDIRLICLERIDTAFKIKDKPLLEAYIESWYPDKNFYPAEASHFIWATYEHVVMTEQDHKTYVTSECSLHELLQNNRYDPHCKHILSAEDADKLIGRFAYLINNCILLPGNYVITELEAVNIFETSDSSPEQVIAFTKNKDNARMITPNSFAVIATISGIAGVHGYNDTRQWFLCDLLDQHKVKVITKKE